MAIYLHVGCLYSHGQNEKAIFCHACFYSVSRKKLWAMIQEKAAGPAVLMDIAFLF